MRKYCILRVADISENLLQFFQVLFVCLFQLEVRLAEKEESLLEKDLIFEQVARLSERVRKKADAGKGDTLSLAKKVRAILQKM